MIPGKLCHQPHHYAFEIPHPVDRYHECTHHAKPVRRLYILAQARLFQCFVGNDKVTLRDMGRKPVILQRDS
jgi:hypothetical protein